MPTPPEETLFTPNCFVFYICVDLAWIADHTDKVDQFQLGSPDVNMIARLSIALSLSWHSIISDAFARSLTRFMTMFILTS